MSTVNSQMVLNERDIIRQLITRELVITPLIDPISQIGSTSVDIRLGFEFQLFNIIKHTHLDPLRKPDKIRDLIREYTKKIHVRPMEPLVLHPREFVLAATLEYFKIPNYLAGRLEGRSTWGRLGLQVHSTAGFVDPGFEGILTFELTNTGLGPLMLFPGVRIAQISFYRTRETILPYTKKRGAKYFKKIGTAGSLFYEDWEFDAIRDYYRISEK